MHKRQWNIIIISLILFPGNIGFAQVASLHQSGNSESRRRSNSKLTPSLFLKKRKKFNQAAKASQFVRDILCLPKSWCTSPQIPIPRGNRRNFLAEKGLLGKIQFNSLMSSDDIVLEVSRVFSQPLDLSKTAIEDGGKRFNFLFLQRAGAGSRTLCRPSLADSFEWDGKNVASLAKAGMIIYIQALDPLPFVLVSRYKKAYNAIMWVLKLYSFEIFDNKTV